MLRCHSRALCCLPRAHARHFRPGEPIRVRTLSFYPYIYWTISLYQDHLCLMLDWVFGRFLDIESPIYHSLIYVCCLFPLFTQHTTAFEFTNTAASFRTRSILEPCPARPDCARRSRKDSTSSRHRYD